MNYDERPDICDGCKRRDGAVTVGDLQITWNSIAEMWLCMSCGAQWSAWRASIPYGESDKPFKPSWYLGD